LIFLVFGRRCTGIHGGSIAPPTPERKMRGAPAASACSITSALAGAGAVAFRLKNARNVPMVVTRRFPERPIKLEGGGCAMAMTQARRKLVYDLIIGVGALAALALPGAVTAQNVVDYGAIIAAPDRSEADRKTDERRDPTKLLAFTGVKPGMTVLDMG